jgi:hypothetical protein
MVRFWNMKIWNLIAISLFLSWLSACASHETKIEVKPKSIPPTAKTLPSEKAPPSKDLTLGRDIVRDSNKLFSAEIVGKPLAGGKFAKLKIGRPVKEVEALIGLPDRQWQQPTSVDTTPYYSGTDLMLIQYAYKKEGILTFNLSPEHFLIRILVNRAE